MLYKEALFSGGCYWCTQDTFNQIKGILKITAGYMKNNIENDSSENSNDNNTRECVKLLYNAYQIDYKKLCQIFLDNINPTDSGGQFYDRGELYKTAIYYYEENEKLIAGSLIRELEESKLFYPNRIFVDILPIGQFLLLGEKHQDFALKFPDTYENYKLYSGRSQYFHQLCEVKKTKKIEWQK